jgi:hypothetical protein
MTFITIVTTKTTFKGYEARASLSIVSICGVGRDFMIAIIYST